MGRCVAIVAVGLAVALSGCHYNSYVVQITPHGDSFERQLTCWREEMGAGTTTIDAEESRRIGKFYATHQPPDAQGRACFAGTFTGSTPADIGGAGRLVYWNSPLGSTSAYIERFRGSDDLQADLNRRRKAVDHLADVILGWFESEMGSQSTFARIEGFLNDDLRRDLQNMALYGWAGDVLAGPARKLSGEPLVRFAQYLLERGYVQPDDLPGLVRAARSRDYDRLVRFTQKFVVRKLNLPANEPLPYYLGFLSTYRRAYTSLVGYVRTTERYKDRLAAWKEQRRADPKAKEPMPDDYLAELLSEAFFPLELLAPSDALGVRLACEQPFDTNGQWDAASSTVHWAAVLNRHSALPVVCYALWSTPEQSQQTVHFGKVVLNGAELAEYVLWYRGLTVEEAREWDQGLIAQCTPGNALIGRIARFRFRREATGESAGTANGGGSLADVPRKLLVKALQPPPAAAK